MQKIIIAAALAAGFALPAAAQSNGGWNGQGYGNSGNQGYNQSYNQGSSGQNWNSMQGTDEHLQSQIRQDLAQAGFSDIQVEPRSFVVRAKDRNGNPVEMMITPHSMTAVTAMQNGNGQNGNENGNYNSSRNQWSDQGSQNWHNDQFGQSGNQGWNGNRQTGSNGWSGSNQSGQPGYAMNSQGDHNNGNH